MLLVEQYVERALAFADDAVILRRGRVAGRALRARPGTELVGEYLGTEGR